MASEKNSGKSKDKEPEVVDNTPIFTVKHRSALLFETMNSLQNELGEIDALIHFAHGELTHDGIDDELRDATSHSAIMYERLREIYARAISSIMEVISDVYTIEGIKAIYKIREEAENSEDDFDFLDNAKPSSNTIN